MTGLERPERSVVIRPGDLWEWDGRTGYAETVEVIAPAATLYVSGQAGTDDGANAGSLREQVRRASARVANRVEQAGFRAAGIVSIRIYTVDIDGIIAVYDEVTAALAQWNSTPASVLVEVARLADPRMLVEVEAVAVR